MKWNYCAHEPIFLGLGVPRRDAFLLPRLGPKSGDEMHKGCFRCHGGRCDRNFDREIPTGYANAVRPFVRPVRNSRKLPRKADGAGRKALARAVKLARRRPRGALFAQEHRRENGKLMAPNLVQWTLGYTD